MRPNTIADAVQRIQSGNDRDVVLAEFVDAFDLAEDPRARLAMLEAEPDLVADPRLNALVAAMAEYLAKQHRLGHVPSWVSGGARRLQEPWFTTSSTASGVREYLTFASPAEFASRNIFTEEQPLRRARYRAPASEYAK